MRETDTNLHNCDKLQNFTHFSETLMVLLSILGNFWYQKINSEICSIESYLMTPRRKERWIKVRSSHSKVFVGKGVLKIYRKFTGEHPCRSVISIKLQSNFIEIALRHRCTPVNLLYILEHLWTAVSEKCNTGFQFEKSLHMHYISTHS